MTQWAKTRTVLVETAARCGVWFSTGIGVPTLAWLRMQSVSRGTPLNTARGRHRAELAVQATLGHSDELSALEGTPAGVGRFHWTRYGMPSL